MSFAGGAVYAMSKSAPVGLAEGLARDLGPRDITVNNVQAGPVDTDLNPATGEFAEKLKAVMALPRYGHADEVAAMVACVAGTEAGFVTGASLTNDEGFTACSGTLGNLVRCIATAYQPTAKRRPLLTCASLTGNPASSLR